MTQLTQTPTKRYARDNLQTTLFGIAAFLSLSFSLSLFPSPFDDWTIYTFADLALFCLYSIYSSASRTGSSASLELRNGRLVAIAHHIPKTGYKAINSYGHKPRFVSETTSKTAQKACFAAPEKRRQAAQNTTHGRRAIAQNSSPKTSSVVVSGSPPRAHRVKKPTEAPVRSV